MSRLDAPKKSYASDRMARREADILATARELLVDGDGSIPMRVLAERSGVALSTLYARFGSQDAIASAAIAEVFRERLVSWEDTEGPSLIERLDQRLASSIAEVLARPPFARKMARLFFTANRDESDAAQTLYRIPHAQYCLALGAFHDAGALNPGTAIAALAEDLVVAQYATIGHWANGMIVDTALLARCRTAVFARLAASLLPSMQAEALGMVAGCRHGSLD
jgi:AcrR family transcriptional regulator